MMKTKAYGSYSLTYLFALWLGCQYMSYACKVNCARRVFALSTSNDTGGRKSRIRRSKEERKSMIESFINKYQKSNCGNFPSLNLTHKEVGGSFYTVREIVREIIQENRVLAPPKVSLEEHSLSGFLEQHPLGSISMDSLIDLSASDRADVETHIVPEKLQFSSAENISSSNGSYPLELNDEQTVSGGRKLGDEDEGSDGMKESHYIPYHCQDKSTELVSDSPQPKSHKFEENIVNGFEVVDGSPRSDKPLMTNADHHHDIDKGPGSQMLNNENQTVGKAKQFVERIYTEPTSAETLHQEKLEAQNIEASPVIKSHAHSDIEVETFPLRPVTGTIKSGKLQEAEHKEIQLDMQNSSSFVSEKGDKELLHSTVELNGENREEKVVLNLQGPSVENEKPLSASKPSVLDAGDVKELETNVSLPDRAKASISTDTLICEDSATVRDDNTVTKASNPTLDRINLQTWEKTAKKSTQPESNPLLALVKVIISSFVKLWTE